MNTLIIDNLSKLVSHLRLSTKDKFRLKAIANGLAMIQTLKFEITSTTQLKGLPNIGKGIIDRIDEILKTGTLAELPIDNNGIDELLTVTGIGPKKAQDLWNAGIKNIEDLRKAISHENTCDVSITHHMVIGLKYHEDLQKKIPRYEIEHAERMLLKVVSGISKNLIMNICGSYRRGCDMSGDIDVLICDRAGKDVDYLQIIVDALTKDGFLIDHLTENGSKKYMGVCKIESLARRIDIRMVDYAAYYACLIYFTGSKNFNIKLRNRALEYEFSLNEYGLKRGDKLITLNSESELFDILEMDYVEPRDRNIYKSTIVL